jgi:26S proteasome regulatory subunit N2
MSRTGSGTMSAIVGMVLFCQSWYWYPLAHCACLAFEPTGIIELTEELKVMVVDSSLRVISNARPALFAYPAPVKPPSKETVEKVATAVLSTTVKAKARERTKEKEKAVNEEKMDTVRRLSTSIFSRTQALFRTKHLHPPRRPLKTKR